VWEAYRNGKLDAAPMQRRTLNQAIEETIRSRRADNRRERYVRELENYLRKFAVGRTEMFVDRIGLADIEQWFDSRNEGLATKRSNLGRLSSLFDVCFRRAYISSNPCLRMTVPTIDHKPPRILSPDEAHRLLAAYRKSAPTMLPWLVLGMFSGVRPDELARLKWRDLDLVNGSLNVDAAASKVRRRRVVPLRHYRKIIYGKREEVQAIDTIIRWLKLCKPGKPDSIIAPPAITVRRWRRKLAQKADIEWSPDLLRHTASSYLLELYHDPGRVAHWLGNSPRILERAYKQLVSAPDCQRFWNLTPPKV
jgi:integrase